MAKIRYTSIRWLKKNEQTAIDESIAMMSYNPSIGRVLKSGGVIKFKEIAVRKIKKLKNIKNQNQFDKYHNRFVLDVMKRIKKTATGKKISYGQGQKPVNVFLKVYVDWASYPNRQVSTRLRKFLHVPLDYRVMRYIKDERRSDFNKIVAPIYRKKGIGISALSLGNIDKDMYYAWQELCRKICPIKPLLLDVIWAKAPRKTKSRKRYRKVIRRGSQDVLSNCP